MDTTIPLVPNVCHQRSELATEVAHVVGILDELRCRVPHTEAHKFNARNRSADGFAVNLTAERNRQSEITATDPTDQITTLHLNPFYSTSNRLRGKNVIVIDDCTTYGVSFGVASAFLRKAGAATVTGVALGKFGKQLRHYDIDILTDPFKPVVVTGFKLNSKTSFTGTTSAVAQQVLRVLIPLGPGMTLFVDTEFADVPASDLVSIEVLETAYAGPLATERPEANVISGAAPSKKRVLRIAAARGGSLNPRSPLIPAAKIV